MKKFDGLAMVVAAAEETGEDLIDGRGDAYCGVLNASYNLKLRNLKAYIPEYPVFFVKRFSLKKASEFPVFSKGFSLL